jgi:hypothetical protein
MRLLQEQHAKPLAGRRDLIAASKAFALLRRFELLK